MEGGRCIATCLNGRLRAHALGCVNLRPSTCNRLRMKYVSRRHGCYSTYICMCMCTRVKWHGTAQTGGIERGKQGVVPAKAAEVPSMRLMSFDSLSPPLPTWRESEAEEMMSPDGDMRDFETVACKTCPVKRFAALIMRSKRTHMYIHTHTYTCINTCVHACQVQTHHLVNSFPLARYIWHGKRRVSWRLRGGQESMSVDELSPLRRLYVCTYECAYSIQASWQDCPAD